MALSIPSISSPYSATPITNAYGWIAGLSLDLSTDQGRLILNVNPSQSDYGKPPITQIAVTLGETLVPANGTTPAVTFPRLDELLADAQFTAAWTTIADKLYTHLLDHPKLTGSTVLALVQG